MEINIPSPSQALKVLLKADIASLWKNRRAAMMTVIVPVILLLSWKKFITPENGAFFIGNSITVGIMATALIGYPTAVSRDRDKGIFQRLRVAPIPSYTIMLSRIFVQLIILSVLAILDFIVAKVSDGISLQPAGYALGLVAVLVGGLLFLSLGQALVGLMKNPETVNATCRLVYIAMMLLGLFGELGMLGDQMKEIVHWSPYGCITRLIAGGLNPNKWDMLTSQSLLVSLGYSALFLFFGIKWFKWSNK